MKLANDTLLTKSPEAGAILVASILGSVRLQKRENALNSFVKRVTSTDVLEGETETAEWESAGAGPRPERPGRALSSRQRPGGRPVSGGSTCWEERQISRLWRYIPNIRNPLLERATGLRRHTELKMVGAWWGLCFIFGFCRIKRIRETVGTVVLNAASARLAQACF